MNTQTAIQTANRKPKALEVMAGRLNIDPDKMLATLKATVFKNANTEELMALVVVSNEYGLNPLLKEIYAFPSKGGGITPVVSVDGWNKMLIRQESFDGIEFAFEFTEDGMPHSCTATVFVKNRSHAVKVTEYYEECHRNTDNWNNMPRRMLRHRALCQASRLAFGFAGVYSEDEAKDFIEVSAPMPTGRGAKQLVEVAGPAEPRTQEEGRDQPPAEKKSNGNTARADLEKLVADAGCTFSHLQKWGMDSGRIAGADSLAGYDDISEAEAKRLLKIQSVVVAGVQGVKGEA